MKYQVYNQTAEKISDISLADSVFAVEVNPTLVHQAAVTQMANARKSIADTKDRSEVRGGGRKPWRQKGTGRARVGSTRSPIWRSGGVTFGPTADRNFSKGINKKMKIKALLMVLSDKIANKDLLVVDKLEMAESKTKEFNKILTNLEAKALVNKDEKRSVLIVDGSKNRNLHLSAANLAGVTIVNLDNINIVELLNYRDVIMTEEVIKILEKRYK